MSRPGDGGDILRRKPAIESVGGFVHMRLSLTTTTYFVRPSIDVQWTRDVGVWGCGDVGLLGGGVAGLWGCEVVGLWVQESISVLDKRILHYRSPFLGWTEEFFSTGVHCCLGQKRILYYRSPCLCCTREFFATGVHVCTGQENSLLQESISVSDNRLLYYRSPFLYCYDLCGQPSYRTESMKLKSAT